MTLADITLPIGLGESRQLALVFTSQLASELADLHAACGSPNCVPVPRVMIDGRQMVSADILTEVEPGGLLREMWERLDIPTVLAAVDVISWDAAVAMLPQDPPLM